MDERTVQEMVERAERAGITTSRDVVHYLIKKLDLRPARRVGRVCLFHERDADRIHQVLQTRQQLHELMLA